jgi:hypothetical protein
MWRIIKGILVLTVIYHIVSTTYQVNVLSQKIESINVVLGRIHAERRQESALEALKKDAALGLNKLKGLSDGYSDVPQWGAGPSK